MIYEFEGPRSGIEINRLTIYSGYVNVIEIINRDPASFIIPGAVDPAAASADLRLARTGSPIPERITGVLRGNRKDLSKVVGEFPAPMLFSHLPLLWVTQGNFFESHAIDRSRTGNVEMPRDDDVGAESLMPVFGLAGAAPDHEARYAHAFPVLQPRWP